MATIPTSYTRFQTSSTTNRLQPGTLVTPVTTRLPTPRQTAPRVGNLFTLPKEPEDAGLTGGTRSLDRRLLALNVAGTLPKPAAGVQRAARKVTATADPARGTRPSAA